jgi:hypothetical protein
MGVVYISVTAVMANLGCTLTAPHLWAKSKQKALAGLPHTAISDFGQRGLTGRPRSKSKADQKQIKSECKNL